METSTNWGGARDLGQGSGQTRPSSGTASWVPEEPLAGMPAVWTVRSRGTQRQCKGAGGCWEYRGGGFSHRDLLRAALGRGLTLGSPYPVRPASGCTGPFKVKLYPKVTPSIPCSEATTGPAPKPRMDQAPHWPQAASRSLRTARGPRKPSFPMPPGASSPSGPPLTPCLPPLVFHIQGLRQHLDPRRAGAGWRPRACGSRAVAWGDALGKDAERPSPGTGPRSRCPPGRPQGRDSVVGIDAPWRWQVTQGPAAHPGGLGREAEGGTSVWHRAPVGPWLQEPSARSAPGDAQQTAADDCPLRRPQKTVRDSPPNGESWTGAQPCPGGDTQLSGRAPPQRSGEPGPGDTQAREGAAVNRGGLQRVCSVALGRVPLRSGLPSTPRGPGPQAGPRGPMRSRRGQRWGAVARGPAHSPPS